MKNDQITIVHITSSLKVGGAESVLCSLIDHMDTHRFKHHVIYFNDGPYSDRLRKKGVTLHHVTGRMAQYDPSFLVRLYKTVKEIKPDCIHSLLWAGNVCGRVLGWMLRIPVISAIHNNVDQDGFIRNMLDRFTVRLSDQIIAVSSEVAHTLQTHNWLVPAERIRIIQNGIDAERVREGAYHLQKTRYELGLSDEHFVIGAVGRFEAVKRYDLLLKSFALVNIQYPLTRLVLIGLGSQEQYLKNLAVSLGIEGAVVFVIGEQARNYYPLFDCFVQSSDKEGISIALLEAMSFARACIVTNSSKLHSVITSGIDGIIVAAGDSAGISKAIIQLLEQETKRISLGYNAQQTVRERFRLDTMVNAYQDLFIQYSPHFKSPE